eukprot:scaffold325465_cov73-Tisochrysis_lutea.AAC.1
MASRSKGRPCLIAYAFLADLTYEGPQGPYRVQTAHLCNERPEEESLGHHRVKRLDERTNEADDVNEQRGR